MKFVRYDDLKEFTKDMKLIYGAPNIEVALSALDEFERKWGINIVMQLNHEETILMN